jgi:hypothetical protein
MVVDANVLIYAVNADSAWHEESNGWLDRALAGTEPVGFSWVVLLAFWRIVTHRGVFETPLEIGQVGSIIESWLAQPASVEVQPTPRHLSLLSGLLMSSGAGGNLVNDAHLAALALEHNATVVSFDEDFARFPGLRHRRPAG